MKVPTILKLQSNSDELWDNFKYVETFVCCTAAVAVTTCDQYLKRVSMWKMEFNISTLTSKCLNPSTSLKETANQSYQFSFVFVLNFLPI